MAKLTEMPTSMNLSVLIPVYNEENVIESTISSLYKTLSSAQIPHEILVIYDPCTDQTETILDQLRIKIPTLRAEKNGLPRGFGFALRHGLSLFQGDLVCIFMADHSDSPQDLVRFYHTIQEGYDCVFGSRFVKNGSISNYPWPKLFLNRLGNLFIRTLFLMKYNDTTNCFKMYRREAISGMQPFLSSHFNLTVELPLKAIIRGYKYAVLPNSWHNRKGGVSKFQIKKMGPRYLFIIFYCLLEKLFSCGDFKKK